jgi:hypothetical protein
LTSAGGLTVTLGGASITGGAEILGGLTVTDDVGKPSLLVGRDAGDYLSLSWWCIDNRRRRV